jgi:hypothetical protein
MTGNLIKRRWKRLLFIELPARGIVRTVIALTMVLAVLVAAVRLIEPTLLATVRIAVGSEDMAFFQDQRVLDELTANNLNVEVTSRGSGQMVDDATSGRYDAVLPSSRVYVDLIADALKTKAGASYSLESYAVFYTPVQVFTQQSLVGPLQGSGVINGQKEFDVAVYLADLAKPVPLRWQDIPGAVTPHTPASEQVILETTDPAKSDSGAMLAAYSSYLLNGSALVADISELTPEKVAEIKRVFSSQGVMASGTGIAFSDFLHGQPLVLGYLSQALDRSPSPGEAFPRDAVALPLAGGNVMCQHTLIVMHSTGETPADKLGNLLMHDSRLQDLERVHGFNVGIGQSSGIVPAAPVMKALINDIEPND